VKNSFGCIPGLLKAEFHVKLPDPHRFARMLVDLNLLVRPRLHIMDGILGMEGNGPRGGKPFPMHAILISADPVALDAVVARLIGVDPTLPPTALYGMEAGLGTYRENEIELLGDLLDGLKPKRFHALKDPVVSREPGSLSRFFKHWVVPRPVIQTKSCTRCGTCVKMCPVQPKAVDWKQGDRKQPPVYDYDRCIRCYCCQELCPEHVISIHRPLLGRLIRR
jgi:Pyruvate/2-oxoacid:ferredoxin oxidoreductase delta subunit